LAFIKSNYTFFYFLSSTTKKN